MQEEPTETSLSLAQASPRVRVVRLARSSLARHELAADPASASEL
jgi:hypothetical protein